jgi:hypothetical protein
VVEKDNAVKMKPRIDTDFHRKKVLKLKNPFLKQKHGLGLDLSVKVLIKSAQKVARSCWKITKSRLRLTGCFRQDSRDRKNIGI